MGDWAGSTINSNLIWFESLTHNWYQQSLTAPLFLPLSIYSTWSSYLDEYNCLFVSNLVFKICRQRKISIFYQTTEFFLSGWPPNILNVNNVSKWPLSEPDRLSFGFPMLSFSSRNSYFHKNTTIPFSLGLLALNWLIPFSSYSIS